MTISASTAGTYTIPAATRLGHVHYIVADLERQIRCYRDILGFKLHWQADASAGLGAGGEDLLRLTEQRGARHVRGTTGLYHTAFLVPSLWELANLLRRIAETRTRIQGMSNHGTHYAIYLPDAEGNGIELAWDLPRGQWPKTLEEMIQRNRGLDPDEVFRALGDGRAAWTGLDSGTVVGHVHLHVADIDATTRFYHDLLGFVFPLGYHPSMPNPFGDTAMFFAAGDYHHHVGTNTWQGVGAPMPPADATGLRYFSVVLPSAGDMAHLNARLQAAGAAMEETPEGVLIRDPASNGIVLTAP